MQRFIGLTFVFVVALAQADVPPNFFPFVIGEISPHSPVNRSMMNATPAGQDGFVQIREGHFVDGRGRRLRFLGTNVTFSAAFPDKEQAPLIARRMAALGINIVRFHHMDNAYKPNGIWDPAYKEKTHLDAEQLDKLDFFIYQLKQNGIYVNLNLHVSRNLGPAEGFESTDAFASYNKGIDNFCARMIEMQKQYARDLLTHENPYTKTRYAEEPCVVIVELNNENSLLGFALSHRLSQLPESYRQELSDYWHEYLQGKYGATTALRKAWDEGSQPLGEELLRNRDFTQGTKEWTLESRHPGEDVFEVVEDPDVGRALHARLVKLGVNPWDFQIHQTGHDLQNGQIYTLRFKIKADPPREVHVGARWDVADWRHIGLQEIVKANGQWREYSFTFRANDVNPQHTRISFNAQNQLGDVWLADVSLRTGGILGLAPEYSLEARNIPFASSNSTEAMQRDWLAFIMELERRYTLEMYRFLRHELGVKAHIIDTQASYGALGGLWRESRLDFIDNHAYWQHPMFPGRPWDPGNWLIQNTPMSDSPLANTLIGLARSRVWGKPYTVSEYDHPAPSDYRAEGLPMASAFAGFQDWDALFQFDYGRTPQDWTKAALQGYFQMSTDPAVVAFMPVCAHLFRRSDVRPGERLIRLRIPQDKIVELVAQWRGDFAGLWEKAAGVPRETPLLYRVAVEWTKTGDIRADRVTPPKNKQYVSDTQEIIWQELASGQWAFLVDTPRTKLAVGRLAGQQLHWGLLTIKPTPGATGHCVVALTSLDNQPLTQSRQMLLVAASRVENQNMQWDESRRTVGRNWGQGPTIVERVGLEGTAARPLRITPLDGAGLPMAEAAPVQGLQFTLNAPTIWHLIERL